MVTISSYNDLTSIHDFQPPDVSIELYNSCVAHLAEVASDPDLMTLSWPPAEFTTRHQGITGLWIIFFFILKFLLEFSDVIRLVSDNP